VSVTIIFIERQFVAQLYADFAEYYYICIALIGVAIGINGFYPGYVSGCYLTALARQLAQCVK
jgi:hypothetical protein